MKIIFTSLFLFLSLALFANNGDTTYVKTHNNVVVVTNPNSGSNEYTGWGVFPEANKKYRKVLVKMNYKCPSGMSCGEWDYIDRVMLRRKGSVSNPSENLELVRFITPYGLQFANTWNFEWKMDITDFSLFLHDSVEIGYVHTGYETNVGRGWLVNLTFALIEGDPVTETLEISRLWDGSFAYGNDSNPINTVLAAVPINTNSAANILKFRLNHTGHGFDDGTGCSEFCDKYRDLVFDNALIERISRWRKCGDNAVYPQGGTWVYDRGNWCPGATVYPYVKNFNVSPSSQHSVKINMEDYSFVGGQANENIIAYMFHQKNPTYSNDGEIEEILTPSNEKEFLRLNPVCSNPIIVIKNNGSNTINSVELAYGYKNEFQLNYTYNKAIPSLERDTIVLPNTLIPAENNKDFSVYIKKINGGNPNYIFDDTLWSKGNIPPNLVDTVMILDYRTNAESSVENSYIVYGENDQIVYQKTLGSMANTTNYLDTLRFSPGCYKLEFYDMDEYGGDGLGFWANSAGGTGKLWLKKSNGQIQKIIPVDFGSVARYSFTVGTVITSVSETEIDKTLNFEVFPNPNNGSFNIDFSSDNRQNVLMQVIDVLGKVVYEEYSGEVYSKRQTISLANPTSGIYFVKLTGKDFVLTRKVMVK